MKVVSKLLPAVFAAAMMFGLAHGALANEGIGSHSGKTAGYCKVEKGHGTHIVQLSDAQKAQIKAVTEKYKPSLDPKGKEFKEERYALYRMMGKEKVDDAAIKAQVSKISALESDLAVQRAHAISEMRAVLTPDQIKKIADKRGEDKIGLFLLHVSRRLSNC